MSVVTHADGDEVVSSTLPEVLARGPGLHTSVRVELTNGAVLVGQLVEMDAATMNMRLDALTHTAVRRRRPRRHLDRSGGDNNASDRGTVSPHERDEDEEEEESKPVALRCLHSIVVRGACVRYVDFVDSHNIDDIVDATRNVRPSGA